MSRIVCYNCRKAQVMCYCHSLRPFASDPQFVILIHPKESRKAINTGRMAFLSISNAILIEGADFSETEVLNHLLADPNRRCFLLFPGPKAIDLAAISRPPNSEDPRCDVFIILDATWAMAKKMFRHSSNLQKIPQVMFQPPSASRFFIREQPGFECYSTIESIHYIIEQRRSHPAGEHQVLLEIFEDMVRKQIEYEFL